MITAAEANRRVEHELRRMEADSGKPLGWLVILSFEEHDFGWVFFYQTATYAKTGNLRDGAAGNAPFIVEHTGALHITGTAEPIENYVERFRKWGDPHLNGDPTCILCEQDPNLTSLCTPCAQVLGELPGKILAIKSMRDQVPDLGIYDALHAIESAGLFPPPPLVEPTLEDLLVKVEPVRDQIRVIEAGWDGDSDGWGVWMSAVTEREEVFLAWLRHPAGDMRVFNGDFTKPEAEMADRVGTQVAQALGVPFWFPARAKPDDDAVRYRDRHQAVACTVCALPLAPDTKASARQRCFGCKV
jgi:hypothetical protein